MGIVLLIIKALLGFVVIPIIIGYYEDVAKKSRGNSIAKWSFKNWAFWALVVVLVPAIYFEIRAASPADHSDDRPLEFFDLAAYQNELDQYGFTTGPQLDPSWINQKQQLVRIFEHAQYAWKSADYDEATNALLALESGQDQVGSLPKVLSFVVSNDLGCVLFKHQRNREFKAFTYFHDARNRVGSRESYKNRIENNIKLLDEMVNKID